MTDANVFENTGELALTSTVIGGSGGGGGVVTPSPTLLDAKTTAVMGGSGGGEGVPNLSPTLLDAALALARKGFKVVPSKDKAPCPKGWQQLATTDEAKIRELWQKWSKANNIGINPVDLLVIDVDGPIGHANLLRLERIGKLPVTARFRSGSSEPHHYQLIFRLPRHHQWIKNKPLGTFKVFAALGGKDCKIDIKSTNGHTVLPGSRHKSGNLYRWENEPNSLDDLALAPFWLVAALEEDDEDQKPLRRQDATEGQGEALDEAVAIDDRGLFPNGERLVEEKDFAFYAKQAITRFPITGKGQRNGQMTAAVASLFSRDLHPQDVVRVMLYWLKTFQDQYTTDYETAREELLSCIDRTITNIASGKFRQARATHYEHLDSIELPAETVAKLNERFKPDSFDWKFVEALVILASYTGNRNEKGDLVFIRDDVQRLIKNRHQILAGNEQIDRMRKKYVTRAEQGPASKLELLVERQKGYRALGKGKAAPSVYAVSPSLSLFLEAHKHKNGKGSQEASSPPALSSPPPFSSSSKPHKHKNGKGSHKTTSSPPSSLETPTNTKTARGDKKEATPPLLSPPSSSEPHQRKNGKGSHETPPPPAPPRFPHLAAFLEAERGRREDTPP